MRVGLVGARYGVQAAMQRRFDLIGQRRFFHERGVRKDRQLPDICNERTAGHRPL